MGFLQSCAPVRKLRYTNEEGHTTYVNKYKKIRTKKVIQPRDKLFIKVLSIDQQTANIFSNETGSNRPIDINLISYTVDESGYIDFPFVGEIYLKGLTLLEAKKNIENELNQYLSNAYITVKFVNNQVTLIGEVNRQGRYIFFEDQISVFEALSLSGGIAEFGNKERITLIREEDNSISYHNLDLTRKDIVESPYFYIEPNDIIVVDPVRAKFRELNTFWYTWPLNLVTTTMAILIFIR